MATPRLSLNVVGARNVGVRRASEAPLEPVNLVCEVQCGETQLKTNVCERTTTPEWNLQAAFGGRDGPALAERVAFKVFEVVAGDRQVLLGEAAIHISALEPNVEKQLVLVVRSPEDAAGWTSSALDTNEDETPEIVVDVLYEPDFGAEQQRDTGSGTLPTLKPIEPPLGGVALPRTLSTGGDEPPELPPPLHTSISSKSATGSPAPGSAKAPEGAAAPTSLELASGDAKPADPSKPPNYLVVTVLEGKELLACDGKGPDALSDPLVKLSVTKNSSQKTKIVDKSLHPKWRQRFYFALTPARQVLNLLVEDNDMFSNDFMGQCSIDLEQWRAHFKNEKAVIWLALEPKKAPGDVSVSDISPERNMNFGLGRICVALEFKHIERALDSLEQGEEDHVTVVPSSRNTRVASGKTLNPQMSGDSVGGEPTEDLEVPDEDEDNESVQRETAEEIKKRQEERQKMFAELSNVQFLSGDYQILVRIIEVRDLKPKDLNGLCDPVVSVECLGQRQHTMVKEKQLSCVFDEYLSFNFRNMDKDTVQQGSIKITVMDADGPKAVSRLFSDTIGFFVVDIPYVYFQKDHEVHRKWVALVGSGLEDSDSIQGYLLLSIVVLGPGDKLRIHPPHEDTPQEDALASSTASPQNDINSLVLIPPRVRQSLSYLVVTIYQAQDLPDMDQGIMRQGGIDGYVRVYFAGQHTVETKRVTVKGSGNLTVEFNQELWFPVLLPTMSNNIFISMWDWDLTADELVGNTTPYLFNMLQKYPDQFTQHWANLYGPPTGYSSEPAARKFMFENPKYASTYRGRIQLGMRIEDGSKSVNDRPHTRNLTAALPSVTTRTYTLRAAIFFGTEIPRFVSKTSWNRNSKMSLKVSIGRHEIKSTRVDNRNGLCNWNEYLDLSDLPLPADIDHVPDVFVHLVRQQLKETRYICYARFKAKDLFRSGEEYPEELKTIPSPQWVSLIEDHAMNDLKDHEFTGNVLMNLRLEPAATNDAIKERAQLWREHSAKNLAFTKYTVFIHVFQARALPAADTNGLLDPYVKATCGGAEGKVNMRLATRDPCFYETIALDVDLPQDPVFLPKVSVQVFDWDQWDADDYVGSAKFALTDFRLLNSSTYNKQRANNEYTPPRPRWYPIAHTVEGDTEGELLLSFELIRKETPGIIIDPPESIRPPMEDRYLEITSLGCRGLQPVGFMPVNTPYMRFEVGEVTRNNGVRFTNPSSKPSGRNPNYLERVVMPIKMPLDALYAPRLNIAVFDQLLGGFYKPLLGSCSVDLSSKMELSNGEPNPLYVESIGDGFLGDNPYIERPADIRTYPGRLPKSVVNKVAERRASRAASLAEEKKHEEHVVDKGAGVAPLSGALSLHLRHTDLDDDDDVPPYLRNRAILDGPVEDDLGRPPFETYSLFRGDMLVRRKFFGGQTEPDIRPVGKFKGMVRLLKHKDEAPLLDLEQFLRPQPYLVRVYVLDALNITPKDENNKSDPYLRLSLGDGRKRHHLINDRDSYRKATLAPKFHKMYEFKAELPGASELRIEVLDYDFFALPSIPNGISNGLTSVGSTVGGDDFIGATIIDLEDRWFSHRWQQLGANGDAYEKRKPLELRPLFAPSSTLAQGNIRLWVDILTEPEMALVKPLDISLPPPRKFEVRVIIYKARNVTPGDFTELSDLFVKVWLQSRDDKAQTTDTHWRARDGKGSFNWRMKFDIELPLDEDNEADKGYLHLQLWDKDVLYDDCLADSVVDLSVFLKQAYKTGIPVDVFAKRKEVRIRGTSSAPVSGVPSLPPTSSSAQLLAQSSREGTVPASSSSVAIDVMSDLKQPLLAGAPSSSIHEHSATQSQSHNGTARPRSPSYQTPAPPPSQPKPSSKKRKEKAESLVKSVKERFGMGDDPENASWLTFTSRDPTTGDRVRAGELLVSVEILPVAVANMRAAGLGRSEPNNFPYLPEPADRLHLSAMWNPLYVLEALMGPKYYRALTSGVACALLVALLIFAGPLVNVFVTMLELIPAPWGFVVFGIALVLLVLSVLYFLYRCRSAIAAYNKE